MFRNKIRDNGMNTVNFIRPGLGIDQRKVMEVCQANYGEHWRSYLINLKDHKAGIAISYGYIGEIFECMCGRGQKVDLNSVLLLDHQWKRPSRRARYFRLMKYNGGLSIIDLESHGICGLNTCGISEMESLVEEKQSQDHFGLYINEDDQKKLSHKCILYVRHSKIIQLLNKEGGVDLDNPNYDISKIVSCYKKSELTYRRPGRFIHRRNNGVSVIIKKTDIDHVICDSSMLALDFVAAGIPVTVGNRHPIVGFKKEISHALSKKDSKELLMTYLRKTTVDMGYLVKTLGGAI